MAPLDDHRNISAVVAGNVYVEKRKIELGRLCLSEPLGNVTRFRNDAMP